MLLDDPGQDYLWWERDQEGYMNEMRRQREEYEKQFAEHMAEKFSVQPKSTLEELKSRLKNRQDRIEALHRLAAGDVLVEHEQTMLSEVLLEIKNNNYIVTGAEQKYRDEYDAHADKFVFQFTLNVPDLYNK